MPTFGGSPLTTNMAFDPAQDKATPHLRGLNLGGMPGAGALSGTTGADCKLIHGDRWQQLEGNLTENIKKNLKTDIKENETWEVHENLTFKVDGKTKDTRVEDVKEYFLAESTFEYFHEHTDHHHEKDHQINPTQTFDILNIEGEFKTVDLAVKLSALEAKGFSADVTGIKTEAWGGGAEAWGWQVGAGIFENSVTAFHAEEDELEARLKGMENEIKGMQSQVAAAKVIIMPVRIGLCIAIHADSPFA